MAYPTAADVVAAFALQGLTCDSAEADVCLEAAIDEWQENTYRPFLSDASSASYYFDGPDCQGVYEPGLVFTSISAINVGLSPGDDTGTLLVEGTDYKLTPYNAGTLSRPYTGIEWLNGYNWSRYWPRNMKITGVAGWPTLPAKVFLAIRDEAMAQAMLRVMQGVSQLAEEDQGPFRVKYDNSEGNSKIELMHRHFRNAMVNYRRNVS